MSFSLPLISCHLECDFDSSKEKNDATNLLIATGGEWLVMQTQKSELTSSWPDTRVAIYKLDKKWMQTDRSQLNTNVYGSLHCDIRNILSVLYCSVVHLVQDNFFPVKNRLKRKTIKKKTTFFSFRKYENKCKLPKHINPSLQAQRV